jgi:uncharacterized protein (TIGR02145 family)
MKKTLLIYISIFYSFFIFSQKKDKIETIEMNLTYNNTTYIGTYIGNIEKIKKNKFPEGSGNFKGVKEGSEPKIQLSYTGDWKMGSFGGNGTLVIADTTFSGNFTDSKLTGVGKAWWKSNGFYYEGEFQNNRGNGTGKINTNTYEYIGSVTNFLANGTGKIVYKVPIGVNGTIPGARIQPYKPTYTGEFKAGDIFGKGTLKYANGDTLTGIWNGLKFTGNGKLTLADGSIYNGDWVNGEKNGPGKLIMKNGNIYDGDWKDDVKNGKGKFTWTDGGIYVGDWKNDLRNGKGKYTWADGDIFDGDWKDDKYVVGILKYSNGAYQSGIWNEKREFSGKAKRIAGNKSIWEGEWEGLMPINNGKVNFENGNIYEGDWTGVKEGEVVYWVIKGKGKMVYPNIGTYEGDFANGIKEGSGDFKYLNGDIYSGDFKNDLKSGIGEMLYKNGTSYRGEWANDLPNGQGEFLQTDDKVLSGKYVNGVFQKPFLCKEVEIGNQVWMAENLTVAKFRNGDLIPQVKTLEEFKRANGPAWCYYEFSESNGLKFGKLYNWYAVNDPRGLAPIGWRIPSPSDFDEMKAFSPENRSYLKDAENPYFISSSNDMPNKIISDIKSKTGWDKNGTNASGFNALPAGFLEYGGYFSGKGSSTYFWTSMCCTAFESSASALQLDKYTSNIPGNKSKNCCFSVRCIKE